MSCIGHYGIVFVLAFVIASPAIDRATGANSDSSSSTDELAFETLFIKFRIAVDNHQYEQAAAFLEQLRGSGQLYQLNNLDYSAGLLQQRSGQSRQAAALFESIRRSQSQLWTCATAHLAECQETLGDWQAAAAAYGELGKQPGFLDETALLMSQARCLEQSGNAPAALAILTNLEKSSHGKGKYYDILLSMAALHEKAGDHDRAWAEYLKILENETAGYRSVRALKAMKKLHPQVHQAAGPAAVLALFLLGKASYSAGEYEDAEKWLQEAIDKGLDADREAEAQFLIGRGLQRRMLWSRAIETFTALDRLKTPESWIRKALLQAAQCRRSAEQYDAALLIYDQLLRRYPGAGGTGEVLYSRGLTYQAKGDLDQALAAYAALAREYPKDAFADDGLWRVVMITWQRGDKEQVKQALQAIIDHQSDDTYRKFALFWQGKIAFEQGAGSDSAGFFQQLLAAYPNSYFALSSRQAMAAMTPSGKEPSSGGEALGDFMNLAELDPAVRLQQLRQALSRSLQPGPRSCVLRVMQTAMAADDQWQVLFGEPLLARPLITGTPDKIPRRESGNLLLAQELLFHGDYDLADRDLSAARAEGKTNREARLLATMMRVGERAERPQEAISMALKLLDLLPSPLDYEALPDNIRRALFPDTFAQRAEPYCRQTGIDPWLLLAVARTESHMNATAVSLVGARGLLQFMPATGRETAAKLNKKNFDESKLFDPATSLEFGAAYLKELLETFKGDVAMAVAAYNGGVVNVKRWQQDRLDNSPEGFIAAIGFSETRDYVQKVLFSYYHYKLLFASPSKAGAVSGLPSLN